MYKHNLEQELLAANWILEKVKNSDHYAQNLYAAMCNNYFVKNEVWPILKHDTWSCSWRYAGGIISNIRQEGDYMDWYCSGIREDYSDDRDVFNRSYVEESHITEEVEKDLLKLGWIVVKDTCDV